MLNVEPVALATVLLSTQSGYYTDYTKLDLKDNLMPIIEHLQKIKANIDGIYTGYIASVDEAKKISKIFDLYENLPIIVDPVFADNSQIYDHFNSDIINEIKKLCKKATYITPNITEAQLLLKDEIKETFSEEEAKNLAKNLYEEYNASIIITSIKIKDKILNLYYKEDDYYFYEQKDLKVHYPGAGDFFAAIFSALILSKDPLSAFNDCSKIANLALRRNKKAKRKYQDGLLIEMVRKELVKLV